MPRKSVTVPAGYNQLLTSIQKNIIETKNKIERQSVEMYWRIGRSIHQYMAASGPEATGAQLYPKLSADLNINERVLYQIVGFYRTYPKLDRKLPLSWSHYRYLSQIADTNERLRWQNRIVREGLSVRDMQILRKAPGVPSVGKQGTLSLTRGKLYYYRVIKIKEQYFVDCGFNNYILPKEKQSTLDNSRIYHSVKEKDYSLRLSHVVKDEIYTFVGEIEKVIDADTLRINIDCGFGIWHREKLRLRGINAPEINTIDGKRSAKMVKGVLAKLSFVIVKTYKEDKYGRYLADVFYLKDEKDPDLVAQNGIFLNQQLLDEGLAGVYEG